MARSVYFNEQILSGGIYGHLICRVNPTCLCQLARREVHKWESDGCSKGWVVSIPSCITTARDREHGKKAPV